MNNELNVKDTSVSPPIGNKLLTEVQYFLCSAAVIEHFPRLKKSKPFKSGYEYDKDDVYFIVATENFDAIAKYYDEVIEPFNEKSTIKDIDFWLRECTNSKVEEAPKGCITKCKEYGVFGAIENIWNLTNEENRAFCIFRMSEYYGLNPIEFINKIAR